MSTNTRRRRRVTPDKQAVTARQVVVRTRKFAGDEEGEEEETSTLEIIPFESEPAYVRASAGVTKSLAPYESLRVDVAITMPCYPEEVESVYQQVSDKVYDLLSREVDNYLGDGSELEQE